MMNEEVTENATRHETDEQSGDSADVLDGRRANSSALELLGTRCCDYKDEAERADPFDTGHQPGCLKGLFGLDVIDIKPAKKVKCSVCMKWRKRLYKVDLGNTGSFQGVCHFCAHILSVDAIEPGNWLDPERIHTVVELYCDGGLIKMNAIGGTWAWCGVDKFGKIVVCGSGYMLETPTKKVTNNTTEQVAIVKALEAMPPRWSGLVNSDSACALGHLMGSHFNSKLPANVAERCAMAKLRAGDFKTRLLEGHPYEVDLLRGIGSKRGHPVSIYNVWCDDECERQKTVYYEENGGRPEIAGRK